MAEEITIRDLIYLDVDKATSLLSQFEGGLLKERKEREESIGTITGNAQLSVKVLKGGIGGESVDKTATEEIKVLHHDLLDSVEALLFSHGFSLDINDAVGTQEVEVHTIRKVLEDVSYLRAEGWASIEDFRRLQDFANNFQFIAEFINKCNRATIEKSEPYQEIQRKLESRKEQLKAVKNRDRKAKLKIAIQSDEQKIERLIDSLYDAIDPPDDWLMEGISKWIDHFNANQIHLRIRPVINSPFEIVANLKPQYFVDTDTDHLIFSYGGRPNVKLTVFGLITSIPSKESVSLDFEYRVDKSETQQDAKRFEAAFRNVFDAVNNFDSFSGFTNYPNIKIYPIAVYRNITNYHRKESF